jgi:Cu2+-exporting ATPase
MTATDLPAPAAVRAEARAEAATCRHCGEPVPGGPPARGLAPGFCCGGCVAAWTLLREAGLEAYYELPERRAAAVRPSGRGFREFDHAAFHALHVRRLPGGLAAAELYLEGVHCASCVWLVERVPLMLDGVRRTELDVQRSIVRLEWDPSALPLSEIARRLDALGYRPHPFRGGRVEALRRAEDRAMVARIGVAGAIAGNVMMVAVALYAGWFGGMERGMERYLRWVSLLLVTPAMVWPARVFFRGAWQALRNRTLHMDVPVALALAAGYLRGAINTLADAGPIYFDGVATLIFLLLVGRFLQQRAQRAAADSAELLHALTPAVARVREGGDVRETPVEALLPGMVLELRPGDTLAADGRVIEGRSELDRSLLTGETRPEPVAPGTRVFAGTVNRGAPLAVRVERAGEESRVGRLMREVERAAARRAPVVRLADRLSGPFVGTVLALAVLTFALWARTDASAALDHAIALLVVTCPCALALATPLAVTVAIGQAARRGILVKGGDALETLARPALLLLDKTGTLTEGRATLARWDGPDEARALVLALERHAQHPVARGFREAWPEVAVPEAVGLVHTPGGGLEAMVEGRRVVVGAPAFVSARIGGAPPAPGPSDEGPDTALTPVWVAVDGRVAGRAAFGDPLRADATAALVALRARGFRTRILSGDDPSVVARVAAALGFAPGEARGGVSPERKLAAVEAAVARGPVIMVGDGVNDAAAIARASVGVGMRGGAEACLAAADVFLAREGVAPLAELARGARRAMDVIRLNVAISIAYNLAGAALAVSGRIDPLIAAILMPWSSLTVVLISWRARSFPGGGR